MGYFVPCSLVDFQTCSGRFVIGLVMEGQDIKASSWGERKMKTLRCLGLLSILFIWVTSYAQGALLGVNLGTNGLWAADPDLNSNPLQVSYSLITPTSGVLTVTGSTGGYTDPSTNVDVGYEYQPDYVVNDAGFDEGTFSLSATITTNGTLLGGNMSIGCAYGVYDPGATTLLYGPGILLQGKLFAFGFQAGNALHSTDSKFDFEFSVTGGTFSNAFGGIGWTSGTTLDTGDFSFDGSFTAGFENGGSGFADTVEAVPEPEPQFLVILSLLGLCWVVRLWATMRKG